MATTTETNVLVNKSATIFNATVVSSAIAAAFDLGLLDQIHHEETVSVREFCQRNDLHYESVHAILLVLQSEQIVRLDRERDFVSADELFQQIFLDKGYFEWLVGGYGTMLQNLSSMSSRSNRVGDFSNRCGKRIAAAGRDYGAHFVDQHFKDCLDETDYTSVADVGCGSADRLIQLATANEQLSGLGIEVNPGAALLARSSIQQAGLQDRIQVVEGDIRRLTPMREAEDVQIIFSFFMGHDLWPRENCLQALNNLRRIFPGAERFLLCDTYNSETLGENDIPIFTLGFELTHAVMGDYVPTMDEWMSLFNDSEWNCEECRPIDIPHSCIFDLRV